MKKVIIFSLKILLYGIILPFKIWQFSKEKLLSKSGSDSIKSLLDKDYIATSWLDWMIDSIIFFIYPLGLFVVVMVSIFTKASYLALLAIIPIYFSTLLIAFMRELGGSFMLLHLNVKKVRNLIEKKINNK